MFHPRVLFRTLVLMLAGCIIPVREEPSSAEVSR